jgi:hypothetical protein
LGGCAGEKSRLSILSTAARIVKVNLRCAAGAGGCAIAPVMRECAVAVQRERTQLSVSLLFAYFMLEEEAYNVLVSMIHNDARTLCTSLTW